MKIQLRYFLQFILLYFTLIGTFTIKAAAQRFSIMDNLDNMSFAEVNVFLQEHIDEIDKINRFLKTKIIIKPGIDDKEERYDQPYIVKSTEEIKHDLDQYFSTIFFVQNYEVPNSSIQLHCYEEYEDEVDKLTSGWSGFGYWSWAKKVFFHIGDVKDMNEEFNKALFLPNETRQIDSVLVKVKYYAPDSIIKTNLNSNSIIAKNSNGSFELKAINGNTVQLLLTGVDEDVDLLRIQALNDAGKPLLSSGSSINSLPSVEMMDYLEQSRIIYSECKTNLSKYKTTKEVKTHLVKEFENLHFPEEKQNRKIASYSFLGNVKSVDLFLREGFKEHSREIMVKNDNAQLLKSQFAVAKDSLTELYGLIDPLGQWIINPSFVKLENVGLGCLYSGILKSETKSHWYSFYKLNRETRTMTLAGFDIKKQLNDTLLLVEREVNGPYGIYNFKTDSIVLPMNYVHVKIKGDLLTCRVGEYTYSTDGKYCGFTIWGHQILPPIFDDLETDGEYFYSESDTYDKNGLKIKNQEHSPND